MTHLALNINISRAYAFELDDVILIRSGPVGLMISLILLYILMTCYITII